MNRMKSVFISAWITLLFLGSGRAIWQLVNDGAATDWYWVLLAVLPGALFFAWLFVGNVARTAVATRVMVSLSLLALAGLMLTGTDAAEPWFWAGLVGAGGSSLYEWWYSRFENRSSDVLVVGGKLPPLEFEQADGSLLQTQTLGKPLLMIFYRGNWCPLCMAQVREIAGHYRELDRRGVEIMLISPQPHGETAKLAKKFDAPMKFLVDSANRMADRLGIKAESGLPAGLEALGYDSDTVMPTVVMTDAEGVILFADLTDNYRVRPEPDVFLEVFSRAGIE